MRQFDKTFATFFPRRADNLISGAIAWIGKDAVWEAMWLIEDGPYAGEWAMAPRGEGSMNAPFAWVPSGDLTTTNKGERNDR